MGCGASAKAASKEDDPPQPPPKAPETGPPGPAEAEGEALGPLDRPKVKFDVVLDPEKGTRGSFTIGVRPDWAPYGAKRFFELASTGYFSGVRVHRVIAGFMAQFGICGDPVLYKKWGDVKIPDDPPNQTNSRGRITFAKAGVNSRSTQLFINFKDNPQLDGDGFPPFGEVLEGMDTVDAFYSEYGERAPKGKGPDPSQMKTEGQTYTDGWPKLSFIEKATVL
eukprot:Hpha_TRINITY_DN15029_c5_g16::TRINITY_DN15029_c5_g16_i1::g.125623::m.125623